MQNHDTTFAAVLSEFNRVAALFEQHVAIQDLATSKQYERLLRFVAHVKDSKTHRFVLTTREYLLRQAQHESESFSRAEGLAKIVLDLGSYNDRQKAEILYNHLYFSELQPAVLEEFVRAKAYRDVVYHQNYSPRIVAAMAGALGAKYGPKEFCSTFAQVLRSPALVWRHALEKDISLEARVLCFVLVSFPFRCSVVDLEVVAARVLGAPELRVIRSGLKELLGSFLSVAATQAVAGFGREWVSFNNPPIEEVVGSELMEDSAMVGRLVSGAVYFVQLRGLVGLFERLAPDVCRARLLAVDESLAASARRLLTAASPEGGGVHELLLPDTPGSRLAWLYSVCKKHEMPAVGQVVRDEAGSVLAQLRNEDRQTLATLATASSVLGDASDAPERRRLIVAAALRLADSRHRIRELSALKRSLPGLFSELEQAQIRVSLVGLADGLVGALHDYEEYDELSSEWSDVTEACKVFGVTLGSEYELDVEERLDELSVLVREEPDPDEGHEATSEALSSDDLDEVFASLEER